MTPEERRHLSEEVAPLLLPYQFSGDGYERKRGDGTPDRGYNLWSGNLETGDNLRMVGTVQFLKAKTGDTGRHWPQYFLLVAQLVRFMTSKPCYSSLTHSTSV